MPAFGCNAITVAFAITILDKEVLVSGGGVDEDGNEIPPVYNHIGFRLSDRIVSAIDRFVGALSCFRVAGEDGIFNRWLFIYPFVGGTDWTHALNLADAEGSGYQGGNINKPLTGPTGNFERFKITWTGAVTHNANGVTFASGGSGNTNIDCADSGNFINAWNRKSHGLYSRTNSAVAIRDMGAQFVEPRNGYTYAQGIIPRYTDGQCYGDLVYYAKTGVTTTPNRNVVAVADSLGLFSDNQRGPTTQPYHYMYKRGVYIAGDNTAESGMGYGDVGSNAWMIFNGTRNWAFAFSTRYLRTLEGTKNTDGTGGTLPGSNLQFYNIVQQLQVALSRAV